MASCESADELPVFSRRCCRTKTPSSCLKIPPVRLPSHARHAYLAHRQHDWVYCLLHSRFRAAPSVPARLDTLAPALGSVSPYEDVAVMLTGQRLLEIPGKPGKEFLQRNPVFEVKRGGFGGGDVNAARPEPGQPF